MLWNQFIAIPNGTRVLNHGYDQCVALANLYHEQVNGGSFVGVGSAYQWYTEYGRYAQLTNKYERLPVETNPQRGDIFVARYGIYNAQHGHIGVVVDDWNGSTFGTKEQNAERNRYVYQTYNRTKANVLGFLRPRVSPIPKPAENEEFMKITYSVEGKAYLVTEDGCKQIPTPDLENLFIRMINGAGVQPRGSFFDGEIVAMSEFLKSMSQSSGGSSGGGQFPSTAAIAKAVNDDAARRLSS